MFRLFVGFFGGIFIGSFISNILSLSKTDSLVAMFIGAFLGVVIISRNSGFRRIVTFPNFKRRPFVYRVRLTMEVNAEGFIDKKFDKDTDLMRFIEKLYNDKSLEVDKEYSLLGRVFCYTIIRDEHTGLDLIFNETEKGFEDEIEVRSQLLSCNADKLKENYGLSGEYWNTNFAMSESALGFPDKYAPGASGVENPISQIPTEAIISTLTRLKIYWGDPMYAVKKFPPELQKALDENKVKYETWDNEDYGIGVEFAAKEMDKKIARKIQRKTCFEIYDEKLRTHIFSTKYLTVSLNIKFMDDPYFE
jgi:hypothetical protein